MANHVFSKAKRALIANLLKLSAKAPQRSSVEHHAGSEGESDFVFIDPPFYVNSGKYAHIPQEVTGKYLLRSLLIRTGWPGFSGKKILDFGCGVRIARTLINLGIDVGSYHGVDVNRPLIEWLSANVRDPRFSFSWIDDQNPLFNPGGTPGAGHMRLVHELAPEAFDLGYVYSVITHSDPDESRRIFETVRHIVGSGGALYFTAFIDDTIAGCAETGDLERSKVSYSLHALRILLEQTGWRIERVYPGNFVQQPAILCMPI